MESNYVIAALMAVLLVLAGTDVWRQFTIRSISSWFEHYKLAVSFNDDFWKLGFRMENLDLKLERSSARLKQVQNVLDSLLPRIRLDKELLRVNMHDFAHTRSSRIAMHELLMNDSAIYKIHCENEEGNLLRVGLNDFRTDERDSCQIFTDADKPDEDWTGDGPSPQSFFEKVPLDEDAFALRPMGAHNVYLSAVPPPMDGSETLPWTIVVGSPVVGITERFRLDSAGHLYSHVMGGYFRCGPGQMVKGFPGSSTFSASTFALINVNDNDVRVAQELVSLSSQIREIQSAEVESHQSPQDARKKLANMVNGSKNKGTIRICIGVPMTSKGTTMGSVEDSPLWSNLFDSFLKVLIGGPINTFFDFIWDSTKEMTSMILVMHGPICERNFANALVQDQGATCARRRHRRYP